jgi:hypothetical protein
MKAISTNSRHTLANSVYREKRISAKAFISWIKRNEPLWELNRLGITAAGILIQVTVAAAMVGLLGLASVNVWVSSPGILLAFLANSVAFGQATMRWVLGFFIISMVVNGALAVYFAIQLLL